MEVLIWIVCISMLIGFSTGVITGYGLAWWSGQGTSTPEEPMCFDKSVETERSTTFESFEFSQSSSSVSHRTANKIGENDVTFVTGFGSVYHSRRDCGKPRAAKTVGKFLPCRECNPEAPPKFYENKVPLPVKRK